MCELRIIKDRNGKTTFGIADAQSVNNTDTAKNKGYDACKKVSGIKRHIVVDINGLQQAVSITTANVKDRDGAIEMLENNKLHLSNMINLLVDGGYKIRKQGG